MTITNSYSIDLGHEELVFLADTLKVGRIPGVYPLALQDFAEQPAKSMISSGLNSLLARKLVTLPDSEKRTISIESVLVAYLHVCANARRFLQYTVLDEGGLVENGFVHITNDLVVLRWNVVPGVHQFCGTAEPQIVLDHLVSRLMEQQNVGHPSTISDRLSIEIAMDEWDQIANMVEAKKTDKIASALSHTGVSTQDLKILASGLSNVRRRVAFAYLETPTSEPPVLGNWAIFSTEDAETWVVNIETSDTGDSMVHLSTDAYSWLKEKMTDLLVRRNIRS